MGDTDERVVPPGAEPTPAARPVASRGVRAALVVAAACTLLEVFSGVLIGGLLLVVPAYLTAILLLIRAGQQGVRWVRNTAIGIGVVLAGSLPIAVALALAVQR